MVKFGALCQTISLEMVKVGADTRQSGRVSDKPLVKIYAFWSVNLIRKGLPAELRSISPTCGRSFLAIGWELARCGDY
jgi:hypothetical protein